MFLSTLGGFGRPFEGNGLLVELSEAFTFFGRRQQNP